MSDSLRPHGLSPTRLLCPWNYPGKNIGMCCHFLLQGISPIQGSNLGLLNCREVLYSLSHKGSPRVHRFTKNGQTSSTAILHGVQSLLNTKSFSWQFSQTGKSSEYSAGVPGTRCSLKLPGRLLENSCLGHTGTVTLESLQT